MSEKILRMGVGVFVGVWVARYLGPEQFGLFSYAQSLVFLFSAISTLGLDNIVVRELVRSPDGNPAGQAAILGSAFALKLAGALLVFPLLALSLFFTGGDSSTNFMVFVIASSLIFQSFSVIEYLLQAQTRSKNTALANTIALVSTSIGKVILILLEAPLMAFAWIVVAEAAIVALGLVYYDRNSPNSLRFWKVEKAITLMLLKESWPLAITSLVVSLYMKIDQVMLKEMLDAKAVGIYAAAARLSEAWYFVPVSIVNSVYPAIIRSREQDPIVYHRRLRQLYGLMIWVGVLMAILFVVMSGRLVNLLYGAQFASATPILIAHIWGGIFISLNYAGGKWYILENLSMSIFSRQLAGAVANIVLNLWLIPLYGGMGAAISTVISLVLSGYLLDALNKQTRVCFLDKSAGLFGGLL